MHHHMQISFVFLVERGFCCVGQAGLELLGSNDLLILASQSVGNDHSRNRGQAVSIAESLPPCSEQLNKTGAVAGYGGSHL